MSVIRTPVPQLRAMPAKHDGPLHAQDTNGRSAGAHRRAFHAVSTVLASGAGLALLAFAPAAAAATPGALDPSFADHGVLALQPGQEAGATAIAVAADGSSYVAGTLHTHTDFNNATFAVWHVRAGGALDTGFGRGGVVRHKDARGAFDVALQPDNKLLAAGYRLIIRYLPNGTRDRSFAYRGVFRGARDTVFIDVAPTPGGGIAALALDQLWLLRADGSVVRRIGMPADVTVTRNGLLVRPDGRIVIVAREHSQPAAYGFLANGSPDPAFADGGEAAFDQNYDEPTAATLTPDGGIVVAIQQLHSSHVRVARLLPNGARDLAFGPSGTREITCGAGTCNASAVGAQPDGAIVLGGNIANQYTNGVPSLALTRLLPNGTLDPDFGPNGRVVTPVSYQGTPLNAGVTDVAIASDGRILATGAVSYGSFSRQLLLVARWFGR